MTLRTRLFTLTCCFCVSATAPAWGQGPANQNREAIQLDLEGKGAEARKLFQASIDNAPTPAARAQAQRAMAMSWAFEGDCQKTAEYELKVLDYWASREKDEPGNAFYQEGESANEAARVCIDVGNFPMAAQLYRKGYELGLKEPSISNDRKALWDFRWEHAQARLAARDGNKAEAEKHVALAKAAVAKMTALKDQQQSFVPYLTGYVALYLGDYTQALADLQKANQSDPFIQCLLGLTYEKLGNVEKAHEMFAKATATKAHNPPAAYAHRMKGHS